jgi:hypothetical protein
MTILDYGDYLIPADSPRLTAARGLDPWTYAEPIRQTERAQELITLWQRLYHQPFQGVTTDGTVVEDRFALADEGFDVRAAATAAHALLDTLDESGRTELRYPVDAPEWRDWYNPEWPMNTHGIRLDEASGRVRSAFTALMRACLSGDGYVKTERVRSANLFLGELYDLRNIMNEWSYHLLLFGEPSLREPWGWSLYGHHLALNCFILGPQIVLTPSFMGAEPTIIDRGPDDRFELFAEEARRGIELMGSLPDDMQRRAQIYDRLVDPRMPAGRWHFADERHLGGAYQDNRVIPYEGVPARELSAKQQRGLMSVVETFIEHLPDRPRKARMRQVESSLEDTWWSWIGPYDGVSPFYYRVQSPVIMVEFDNHTGVWLTNTEPARFHVHTVVRTPNGNDYGKDLLRQHYAQAHGDRGDHDRSGRPAEQEREGRTWTSA